MTGPSRDTGSSAVRTGRGGPAILPTRRGSFAAYAYDGTAGAEHIALVYGDVASPDGAVLVRVHSSCVTGDIFGSLRCDCGAQLNTALEEVVAEGVGAVVYLDQEGRGIGLTNKIRAYVLQDQGLDTVDANEALGFAADQRSYADAADILNDLGIASVRLLTNNPRKVDALAEHGIDVTERVPIIVGRNPHNQHYLGVKASRLGHRLPVADE